ncbi:hypothetical protein NSA19_02745 [Actinomyces bowdenii]|uniref:hypothetical protein n=1 Tax=Actinomyces bowdenii TaxID=131109 RepID=UPI00214C7C59|nr:hypothetical protein [Actinomyces bowdenii]MCR2051787.1 hypothetical protein [Actinomyces bowdenii]
MSTAARRLYVASHAVGVLALASTVLVWNLGQHLLVWTFALGALCIALAALAEKEAQR